jgi:hypothetical protein
MPATLHEGKRSPTLATRESGPAMISGIFSGAKPLLHESYKCPQMQISFNVTCIGLRPCSADASWRVGEGIVVSFTRIYESTEAV